MKTRVVHRSPGQLHIDLGKIRLSAEEADVLYYALTEQPGRKVLHLLFAHTTKRGTDVEVIEDVVPLYDVKASVRSEKQPSKVLLAPQNEPIPFTYQNGRVDFTVPKVLIHQMVSIEE